MYKVNLNDNVKVILTQYGANKLNAMRSSFYKKFPGLFHWYEEGETYVTQLWTLMEEFGDDMYLTNPNMPFENLDIYIMRQ